MMKDKSMFTECDIQLITPDLNIRRYINSDVIDIFKPYQVANTNFPNGYGHGTRTHDVCISLTASMAGIPITKVIENRKGKVMLRIRKLTPRECVLLMGFTNEDYDALKEIGMSDSAIYHMAGDSIITTCLASLISSFVNEDHKHIKIIEDYVNKEIKQ